MEASTIAFSVTHGIVKSIIITPPSCFPGMEDEEDRIESMKNFPVDQAQFAYAGFFYKGRGNALTCYQCALNIRNLIADPFVTHAFKYDSCSRLLILRGQEFVDRVKALKSPVHEEPSAADANCKVCLEKPATILLLPCRHLALCSECKMKLESCPVCRKHTTAAMRVFMC